MTAYVDTSFLFSLYAQDANLLHVASALALEADTFNSFDDRQRRLAKAVGLKTS